MDASIASLRYFIAAACFHSFSSAARELYVDSTTISKAVSTLEKDIGLSLFNKTGKVIELTPYGFLFYERALSVMAEMQEFNELGSILLEEEVKSGKLSLAITTSSSRGTVLGSDVIKEFERLYPSVHLNVFRYSSTACLKVLEEGLVDVSIIPGIKESNGLRYARVGNTSIAVVMNRRSDSDIEIAPVKELADRRIAAFDDPDCFFECFSDMCLEEGFAPLWEEIPPGPSKFVEFVEQGGVVIAINTQTWLNALYEGFSIIPLQPRVRTTIPIFLAYQKRNHNPHVYQLKELVRAYYRRQDL